MVPLVAALSLTVQTCGLPALRDGPPPFAPGESLSYDVDLMGILRAGTLTLAVEPPISRGELIPLRARVRNTSLFARVRRLRGYALSWIDARTLRPQRYLDEAEEDGARKSTDTRLDVPGPLTMAFTLEEAGGSEKRWTALLPRQQEVMDILSAIYYLRAARLRPGEPMCFDLVANRRFWRLHGAAAPGVERVESAAGTFDTVRVDAVLTRADGAGPKRRLQFWFSHDRRRLPVAASSSLDFGSVRATLSQAEPPAIPPD